MGFGIKFRAKPNAVVEAQGTPPSGRSPEVIQHCAYDTQLYTSGATTRMAFFSAVNADKTLSNMEAAGQFPAPQIFSIHQVCVDLLPLVGVSTGAVEIGNLDDFATLLYVGRPTWTLNISNKNYGPYPLTLLHGTGGPTGFGWGTSATSNQFARNDGSPGWDYCGSIIIKPQTSFTFTIDFAAAQTLTGNVNIRVSLIGVLNRAVQ